ncbi:hypothetical protein DITRI_Ditri02bG0078400 [Diplodiscus trichospermus]
MEGPPSKSSKTKSSKSSMDNLPEPLLRENFHRIPCIKSLVRCKSVSHHWYNIISNPFFINHKLLHQQGPKPFTLLLNSLGLTSKDLIFQSPGFKLFFLPRRFVRILSSCNDLILCYSLTARRVFYICNPMTLQYLALTPYPENDCLKNEGVKFGILTIYEGIENQWKHRLVRIHCECRDLVAETFSFAMGGWTETVVLGPSYNLFGNSVAYNGFLHWLAEPSAIIIYDFDNMKQYRFISSPIRITMVQYPFCSQCLGVCCGVLRILELTSFQVSDDVTLTVWELEDYPNGNWNVEYRICLHELVPAGGNSQVQIQGRDRAGKHQRRLKALGVHANNRDVVFLQIDVYVASCNLETKELKVESTADQLLSIQAFQVELPWWPTPIPTLPQ